MPTTIAPWRTSVLVHPPTPPKPKEAVIPPTTAPSTVRQAARSLNPGSKYFCSFARFQFFKRYAHLFLNPVIFLSRISADNLSQTGATHAFAAVQPA